MGIAKAASAQSTSTRSGRRFTWIIRTSCSGRRSIRSKENETPARGSRAFVCSAGLCGFVSLDVHAFGDLGEKLVGFFLFTESLVEDARPLLAPELLGEGADGSVSCHLIVFDALARGDDAGVDHGRIIAFADETVAFGDDALHPLASLACGLLA